MCIISVGGFYMICKAIDCNSNVTRFKLLNLCGRHYQKFRRYGDENFKQHNDTGSGELNIVFLRKMNNLRKNFSDKQCWVYPDKPMKNGYASVCSHRIYRKGKQYQVRKLAHRLSYEMYNGKIPTGKIIDHLCRVRNCVNPFHLRVCTIRENLLCGNGFSGINSRKTHCKNGHKFCDENIYPDKNGFRICKICHNAWVRNRRKLFPERYRKYDRKRYGLRLR